MIWYRVRILALASYFWALLRASKAAEVNVDSQMEHIFDAFNAGRMDKVMPLLSFEHVLDPIILPGVTTTCDDGKVFAPRMHKSIGAHRSVPRRSREDHRRPGPFFPARHHPSQELLPDSILDNTIFENLNLIEGVAGGVVNVDALMPDIILELHAISAKMPDGVLPLNPIKASWNNSILPFKFDFECVEGFGRAPDVSRRMGNTLDIVSENQTILHMKLRCGEAQFYYPNCKIDSNTKMFTAIDMQLEGVLQNSDFDIAVILNHYPTCNATLGDVSLVEMSNMSFKFLENKLPKVLSDLISNFLAKYNKKLLDDCVVRAVEESISQLTEKIDLCEIFHPNLRVNDEL